MISSKSVIKLSRACAYVCGLTKIKHKQTRDRWWERNTTQYTAPASGFTPLQTQTRYRSHYPCNRTTRTRHCPPSPQERRKPRVVISAFEVNCCLTPHAPAEPAAAFQGRNERRWMRWRLNIARSCRKTKVHRRSKISAAVYCMSACVHARASVSVSERIISPAALSSANTHCARRSFTTCEKD